MNKNDYKMLIIIILLIVIMFCFIYFNKNSGNTAKVYYKNDLIKTINLKYDNIYKVTGENGEIIIEVKNNMIRVVQENSDKHLCSKQGFIKNKNETITCLPNKILITIDGDVDTVVE